MATAPPTSNANLISTHRALLSTLTSFLTVCVHQILYLRHIYPPASFLATRAYNFPVRQSRHPAVCSWINAAISAIQAQLAKNTVSLVALCIHDLSTNAVLEKWSFDLHSLPAIAKRDRDVPFSDPDVDITTTITDSDPSLMHTINQTDLEATFRATLSRLSTTSSRLSPLPSGPTAPELTFTLTIELRDTADRPVGRLDETDRQWIVAEADPSITRPTQPTTSTSSDRDLQPHAQLTTGKTHPIRRLSHHPLNIEIWVEESAHKLALSTSSSLASVNGIGGGGGRRDAATRVKETSFGAGTEKYFDPNDGYEDLEGTDLNRKPGGGIGMDYRRQV